MLRRGRVRARMRLAVAAAVCAAMCAGARAQDKPDAVIALKALGYQQESEHVLATPGYVVSSLHYVDETHLLFTFNSRGLIRREAGEVAGTNPQVVEAVLLELPKGRVVARAEWKLADHQQYLWPLGKGMFLLRMGADVRLLAPLGDAELKGRLLMTMPAPVSAVAVSPDGRIALVQAEMETKPYDAATRAPAQHEVEARFLQSDDWASAARGESKTVKLLQRARVPAELVLPLNGEGYVAAKEAFPTPDDWDVIYTKMSGEQRRLGDVVSACRPQMEFVSATEMVVETCNGSETQMEISVVTLDKRELWQSALPSEMQELNLRTAAGSGRFVLESMRVVDGGAMGPFTTSGLRERVDVLDVKSGEMAASVSATPAERAAQNFDLAPDGRQLAVLEGDGIGLFNLPAVADLPAAKIKPKDYIFVAAVETAAGTAAKSAAESSGKATEAVIEAPMNVDARRVAPTLLTPEEQAKRAQEGNKQGPIELPPVDVPKKQPTQEQPANPQN